MALTEDLRHRIHNALEELMEPELANGIMDMLPPAGWADVATKRDLDHLATTLRSETDGLRADLRVMRAELQADFQRGLRTQLLALMSFNVTLVVAVAAIAGLT